MIQSDNVLQKPRSPRKVCVCPMCHGRGVCEQKAPSVDVHTAVLPPAIRYKSEDGASGRKSSGFGSSSSVGSERETIKLPSLAGSAYVIGQTTKAVISPTSPRKLRPMARSKSKSPMQFSCTDTSLPSIYQQKTTPNQTQSHEENLQSNAELQLLAPPKRFEFPQEALKLALRRLRNSNWNQVVSGMEDVVQVARFNPELLDSCMPVVNRTLCSLLRSLRSQVVRGACQAANELFRTMQCTQRPDFDEIVGCLVYKTADMNRFIRQDANEALDGMVTYIPSFHAVRALVEKGASHKNPLVRTAVARLLTCIVVLTGPDNILNPLSNKDTRRRILLTTAQLLADGSLETRRYAKQLFRLFMDIEEFDTIFHNEVDRKTMGRIEKTLVLLRYQVMMSRQHLLHHQSQPVNESYFQTLFSLPHHGVSTFTTTACCRTKA